MEGQYRPNHFRGVGIIVTKLFHQVQPKYVYFGLKDYQQYMLISKLVTDLDFPVKVIGVETVRDFDGLAYSSRNQLLSKQAKIAASEINKILSEAKYQLTQGIAINKVLEHARRKFSNTPSFALEYLTLVNEKTLEEVQISSTIEGSILLVALYVEDIRLIDNIKIDN